MVSTFQFVLDEVVQLPHCSTFHNGSSLGDPGPYGDFFWAMGIPDLVWIRTKSFQKVNFAADIDRIFNQINEEPPKNTSKVSASCPERKILYWSHCLGIWVPYFFWSPFSLFWTNEGVRTSLGHNPKGWVKKHQELRMLSSVTINFQVTKDSGSPLSEL